MILGIITRTRGLAGEVKVVSYAESPESFAKYERVFIQANDGSPERYELERFVPRKNLLAIKFRGVDTIEDAEKLIGARILVERALLEDTEEDEFYWQDLIGLEVVDERKGRLGVIKEVFSTGANDVFVVEGASGEILVPAVWDVVREINLHEGRMLVAFPEVV